MTLLKNENYAFSLLASGVLVGATSLVVTTSEGALFPSTGYFMCAIWGSAYASPGLDPDRELVKMTLVANDTFTIARAQESTTAAGWSTGDNIALVVTAGKVDELEDKIQDGVMSYGSATGTNAYTAVFDPAITAYESGLTVQVRFILASTGAVTFAANALALKKIYGRTGTTYTALGSGDIIATMLGTLIYDAALDGAGGGWIFSGFRKEYLYENLDANSKDIKDLNDIVDMNDITLMVDIDAMTDINSMNDIVSMNDITAMNDITTSRNITFTGVLNSISTTVFSYLSGLSSNIQAQFNALGTVATKDFGTSVGEVAVNVAGEVITCLTESVPAGTLECNGATISRTTYSNLFSVIGDLYGVGDGSTTFELPNLRGKFLRGWDHGAGIDPDAASRTDAGDGSTTGDHVGTRQAEDLLAHTHTIGMVLGAGLQSGSDRDVKASGAQATTSYGGNETRPVNVNVMYCIRY